MQKGFKPTDSIASIFFGGWYTHAGYGPRATWQEKMRHALAAVEQYSPPLVVIDPVAARGFVDLFGDQHRGGRRETQGAWKMISSSLRAVVSIDAWR